MKAFLQTVIVLAIASCTEPFHFEGDILDFEVVDGKISTLEGRSYVRIYKTVGDTILEELVDFNVRVISGDGEEFQFVNNLKNNRYVPENACFKGVPGKIYKLQAQNPQGAIYESSYDSIPDTIELNVGIKDTTVSILVSAGNINRKRATAALAEIPASLDSRYAKLEFRYLYIDYFTGEKVEVKDEDSFVLNSCVNASQCAEGSRIPIGLAIVDTWYFLDFDACNKLGAGSLSIPPDCPFPCCHFEEDWDAEFEITLEAISASTYAYWENLEKLRGNDGLVFDTYPFPLRGNVICETCDQEVAGLFRAVSETIATRNVRL